MTEDSSSSDDLRLLVVDDDDDFRGTVLRRFRRRGFDVEEARDGREALDALERRQFDVAIVDMVMPRVDGLEFLRRSREARYECEIVLLTGQGTIESAVQAMRDGAYDYLTKPFPLAELEVLVQKAADRQRLRRENERLRTLLDRTRPTWAMIGESPAMLKVFDLVQRAGRSEGTILVEGESGTGKELVARALHAESPRAEKPLVVFNCASLSESLVESELFGHDKGAFTGAVGAKTGLFELADGGTLFIDEIGEMPLAIQPKLLRVLEDGTYRRVGSVRERTADVRVVVATNRTMADEVAAGRFREDLYYRINVLTIRVPPLRERSGDVPLLVSHFLGEDWTIEPEAMRTLAAYSWPGNVRQLVNVVERARILADDRRVTLEDLPDEIRASPDAALATEPPQTLEAIERTRVESVLAETGGNKTRAAKILGISRRALYRLLDKHDIHP